MRERDVRSSRISEFINKRQSLIRWNATRLCSYKKKRKKSVPVTVKAINWYSYEIIWWFYRIISYAVVCNKNFELRIFTDAILQDKIAVGRVIL